MYMRKIIKKIVLFIDWIFRKIGATLQKELPEGYGKRLAELEDMWQGGLF